VVNTDDGETECSAARIQSNTPAHAKGNNEDHRRIEALKTRYGGNTEVAGRDYIACIVEKGELNPLKK
jgi:hypothetical protein